MNVICICLDTFRADIVGPNQKMSFVETPNMDAFAAESVVFERAFGECQPTLQTRRGLFTGRRTFPWRYNFDRRGALASRARLAQNPAGTRYARRNSGGKWVYEPGWSPIRITCLSRR